MSLSYITKEDSFASLSATLLLNQFGKEVAQWDSESLWIELLQNKQKPDDLARAKIQAFLSIAVNPMVLWEVNTFQNTVLAANNQYPIPEQFQENTPIELAWGMLEIRDFIKEQNLADNGTRVKWGDDIICYIAACLRENGWFLAPPPLTIAQEQLDVINANTHMKEQIAFEWNKVKNTDLQTLDIPQTNEMNLQIIRLWDYHLYLKVKSEQFKAHKVKLNLSVSSQ